MKRILAFLLIFVFALGLVACGEGGSESSAAFSTSDAAGDDSKAESKAESVADESDSVSDTSTEELKKPNFIGQFLSIGEVDAKLTAESANSVRLTAINEEPVYGAIVLYTVDSGYVSFDKDCAVAIFEYKHEYFGYVKTEFFAVDEEKSFNIPDDGFAIYAHSSQTAYIDRLAAITSTQTVFPHGIHLYNGADYTVKFAEKAPAIDGKFNKNEWNKYKIDDINGNNISWAYPQFEKNNYYSTATYYTAYDNEYIYLCVVVESPYHYCPITPATASDMWQYECIQVKVSSESPNGEYIAENFDQTTNKTAVNEGVVRSYGFAVNDDGETCYYEGGITTEFTGLAACSRDDASQTTVYEVAIPFAEFEITPESGTELGLTFSINSTNEEDAANKIWKNITYRNGGGVIGRNDWSKIPVITLE